ncbi:hypothetical protein KAU19_01075 [Candidatus Parcubacteria bacterium]|nr:hypothetical protein [Candidatus Parcubacteria bacterium]
MPMPKSSLTKNKDFQRLSKLYGIEDTVYLFDGQGELNFFGKEILNSQKDDITHSTA